MASLARALEGLIWRGLPDALQDSTTRKASIVTEFFHNMHAMAMNGNNFHPIAACTMASMMAFASCFSVRMVENFVPIATRREFTLVAKGAPCVYAASIIATAAYNYTVATNGRPLNPEPTKKLKGAIKTDD